MGAVVLVSGARCTCGHGRDVDVVRDVLDLAAVVLGAGPRVEYVRQVELLLRTPRESVQGLATVLLSLSRDGALGDVRHMAQMHALTAAFEEVR